MHWHSPQAFFLLIPWLGLIIFYILSGYKKKGSFLVSTLSKKSIIRTPTAWLSNLPDWLQILSLLIIIIALARPQITNTHTTRRVDGVDIFIVLDTSDSMLIDDMSPGNRIEAAKTVIKNFISGLVYDRVGLIAFSGESYTRVPLTLDYPVLHKSLSEVQTSHYDPYIKKGTAIGVALANAVARLKLSSAKSKVILFLTDGEDNVGVINPETALEIVKHYQIRVYTIGVGSYARQARIPRRIKDPTGRTRIVYQTLASQINETLLKKIAHQTGGKYYRANNTKALENIFSEISTLEKSPIEIYEPGFYTDSFPIYLKGALILYSISLIFSLTLFWRTV